MSLMNICKKANERGPMIFFSLTNSIVSSAVKETTTIMMMMVAVVVMALVSEKQDKELDHDTSSSLAFNQTLGH